MPIFDPKNHTQSPRHQKIYAYCEVAYTIVDVTAAIMFIIGSALFFNSDTEITATWLFLVGSLFFGLRPMVKLIRELAYLRIGDYDDISKQ